MQRLLVTMSAVLVPLAAVGCGSSKSGTNTSTAPAAASSTPAATSTQSSTKGGCEQVAKPAARSGKVAKPTTKLDASKTYTVTVQTNCGTFAFKLNVKDSPHVTSAFAGLVKKGYFDGLTFHRIVPGFVIQGGDPSGNGTGGPGFSVVDKPPANADYKLGVVAMAKTQTEPKGAAGSQFFVVTGQDAQLPPDYALLGDVTKGIDVVQKIGQLGDPNDPTGAPTQVVVMKKVTVSP